VLYHSNEFFCIFIPQKKQKNDQFNWSGRNTMLYFSDGALYQLAAALHLTGHTEEDVIAFARAILRGSQPQYCLLKRKKKKS
jgi:hypothetical protein